MAKAFTEHIIKPVPVEFPADIKAFLDERKLRGEPLADVLRRLLCIGSAEVRFNELQNYLTSAKFRALKTLTSRYLGVLGFLHQQDRGVFAEQVLPISKGKRVYSARSRKEIDRSGTSTWPHPIPDSPFWALTNMSNERKGEALRAALDAYGYPRITRTWVLRAIRRDVKVKEREDPSETPRTVSSVENGRRRRIR